MLDTANTATDTLRNAPKTVAQRSKEWRARQEAAKEAAAVIGSNEPESGSNEPVSESDAARPKSAPEPAPEEISGDNLPDISRPPKRLPVRAKCRWTTLSPEMREDIWTRELEYRTAFDANAKRYEGLGHYVALAEKNGTTLLAAVEKLARFETLFCSDALAAIDAATVAYNLNPKALAYAYAVRHQVIAAAKPPPSPDVVVAQAAADATIAAFAADPRNEFFSLVRDEMQVLIGTGQCATLHEAYRVATSTNSYVQELLMARHRPTANPYTPPRQVAVQASRNAAKAIGGAPSNGNPRPKPELQGDVYDVVAQAVARSKAGDV